jgi:deoxyribodipyrimidine photo-lyase
MLSAQHAVVAAQEAVAAAQTDVARQNASTFLTELIWREFYQAILHNFPHVRRGNFRSDYDGINWINDADAFKAWCDGQTGVPVVDAAMRQLLATGWMHNRARMIVASFLTKNLLIDWRWGERWFMQNLIDGDLAANNGGWQWSAGTGTDAAPYFRIFNPVTQSKKFDPAGDYIRRWVPELTRVSDKMLHAPWEMSQIEQETCGVVIGRKYPAPLVDLKLSRQRALDAYKAARS